ncbi:MAG: hypothetical protein JWM68_495, partial [Verrucomicrobiales bacterium]|nr:hypothetical protein [Verrucomicrobiales bacterium]
NSPIRLFVNFSFRKRALYAYRAFPESWKEALYAYNATFRNKKRPCTRKRRPFRSENHLVRVQGLLPGSRNCPCTRTRSFLTPGNRRISVQGAFLTPGNRSCTDIPEFSGTGNRRCTRTGEFSGTENWSLRILGSFLRWEIVLVRIFPSFLARERVLYAYKDVTPGLDALDVVFGSWLSCAPCED